MNIAENRKGAPNILENPTRSYEYTRGRTQVRLCQVIRTKTRVSLKSMYFRDTSACARKQEEQGSSTFHRHRSKIMIITCLHTVRAQKEENVQRVYSNFNTNNFSTRIDIQQRRILQESCCFHTEYTSSNCHSFSLSGCR